jgi:hypothetical protein
MGTTEHSLLRWFLVQSIHPTRHHHPIDGAGGGGYPKLGALWTLTETLVRGRHGGIDEGGINLGPMGAYMAVPVRAVLRRCFFNSNCQS